MNRTIIIMAKVPAAGTVKTRLHSILPPEKCAELAEAFLQDTLKKSITVCKNIILAYSPASRRKLLENMISPAVILIEQQGENLGERMANAFRDAFRTHSPVVMIGTDSPTFPARYLAQAFEALERGAEIVLGKSRDGGFYLIGLREPQAAIFDFVAWGSSRVYAELTRNIESLGIRKLKPLPEHYDVDTPADFFLLKEEIFADESLQKSAEKTFQWLKENEAFIAAKS